MSVNVSGLHIGPAALLQRLLPGMNLSAVPALPQLHVAVEPLEHRRQITNDAFQIQFSSVNEVIAFGAVPLDTIHCTFRTRRFDHQPDAPRGTLRRMANMLG